MPGKRAVPEPDVLAPRMQWMAGVQGTITGRDVIIHSLTILRLWGPGTYLRCLKAVATRRPCTFLEVLYEDGVRQ